ncbi:MULTISPECIES: hypothetical protein [Sphingomonadales]|uniref:Uncharacterized protein n=2 Tax=Edaphosphingomonas TaxID=3423724 RepID=A0A2T4I7M1_9SPHN|nr:MULTISPECIES: hypothetical protein [Sphingomonas]AGH48861.1 hypothetical protein G432_05670 [Sphingomonas sp. MM-1]MDX3885032.1 hypothetical protein [Sphingomonas sp.]OHT21288.1 hypothetical protein BHE75_03294 [Sphingomonas haloaromaticamans]PTD27267.1 hypothetical protein CV103_01795 [Sphingomonas fennica]
MRALIIIGIIVVLAAIGALATGLVDISQTQKGQLPRIAVEGGQAPRFDVKTADVKVGTTTRDVDVPRIDVGTRKEEVKVPTVDVDKKD